MKERGQGEISNSILGGWVKTSDGLMTPAENIRSFTTEEYEQFTESQRARWNLAEFVKIKIQQLLQR
jgi:hypothetical protein